LIKGIKDRNFERKVEKRIEQSEKVFERWKSEINLINLAFKIFLWVNHTIVSSEVN